MARPAVDRLDEARLPELDQPRGLHQGLVPGRQEEAVARRPWPATRAAHALEEAGHGRRGVDLDHAVEVANVDAQLQDAGGHDHAVVPVGEGVLRLPPLLLAERAVRDEGRCSQLPQLRSQFLGPGTAVHEDQPLLAAVQPGDNDRRVLQRADVVQLHVRPSRRWLVGQNNLAVSRCTSRPASRRALGVADRRRQPDPLRLAAGQAA